MNRRDLLGLSLAAVGGVFVPRFGRWFRSPPPVGYADSVGGIYVPADFDIVGFDKDGFTLDIRGNGKVRYAYKTGTFASSLTGPVTLHAPRIVAYAL